MISLSCHAFGGQVLQGMILYSCRKVWKNVEILIGSDLLGISF